jgi:hypothetical protein
VSEANGFELVVRYEQKKIYSVSTTNWLSGATSFNVATVPVLNHRSELLTYNADLAKYAEHSHIFI